MAFIERDLEHFDDIGGAMNLGFTLMTLFIGMIAVLLTVV